MRSIRRVLVAVKDPAARSQPAVAKGVQLARVLHAQVELFHAIAEPVGTDLRDAAERSAVDIERGWCDYYRARLERLAARWHHEDTQVTTVAACDFPVAEAIVREAGRCGADLIVAERHATRHVAPWLLGYNDWELLRESPVPVLLVKRTRAYADPVVLAAVDPSHSFAKPARLDGEILRTSQLITSALHGTLHAVHAYAAPGMEALSGGFADPALTARSAEEASARARRKFDRLLGSMKLPSSRRHLLWSHPSNAILEVARKTRSDIVVMGAISRSGLKSLFVGNTAEQVLDQLGCDVLVVKPPHFAARVPARRRGMRFIAQLPLAP